MYFNGQADGSYDNHVQYAGNITNNVMERYVYNITATANLPAGKYNPGIAGSTLAFGDAVDDVNHYTSAANNTSDLSGAATGLAGAAATSEGKAQLYAAIKLFELQTTLNGGSMDVNNMPPEVRLALAAAIGSAEYGTASLGAKIIGQALDKINAAKASGAKGSAAQATTDTDVAKAPANAGSASNNGAKSPSGVYGDGDLPNVYNNQTGGKPSNGGSPVSNPGFDASNLESKLKGYLLDTTHPQNQTKADWFNQALGFNQNNWENLASQIYFDPATAISTKTNQYGQTYNQIISITGPNGKTIDTTFVFIKDNSGNVKLVTGIPAKR